MKKYSTKIIFSVAVAILSISVIGSAVFSYLLVDKINNINDKIKQMDLSTQERNKQGAQKMSVVDTEADRAKLESYFVSADGAVDFIKYLENLSVEVGVKANIQNINFQPLRDTAYANTAEYISLNLSVEGTWAKVYRYVLLLEKLPFVSEVGNVDMTEVTQTDEKNKTKSFWTATISLKVIKLKNI
ncbi:MAG: hypothetical protein WCO10_00275 [bacterium]